MFGGEYRPRQAEKMLNEVMTRVALASDRPDQAYKVTILNSPVVNAFALHSGNLYVTRGLLALANDTSEIAAVMAHEIAHVTANHAIAARRAGAPLARSSAASCRRCWRIRSPAQPCRRASQFSLASFSRAQELEADQIGVRTIAKAGFDPYGAARFLASLGRQSAMRATHARREAEPAEHELPVHPPLHAGAGGPGADGGRARSPGPASARATAETYLTAIDGITFGDDPGEGMVRGQRFLHPAARLHLHRAARASCWRTPRAAVVGVTPGGAQALRFDSVKLPDGPTLASYLEAGWIEGVEMGAVEEITVNGLPAVTALAKGDEWTFRMAAIQFGRGDLPLHLRHQGDDAGDGPGLAPERRELPAADAGGGRERAGRCALRSSPPSRATAPRRWRPAWRASATGRPSASWC